MQKSTIIKLSLALLPLLIWETPSFAAGPFHCAGRVQFRPCDTDAPAPKRSPTKAQAPSSRLPKISSKSASPYARVISHTFSRTSSAEGVWKGVIEGNGEVQLELQMVRNGKVEVTWYMGHVKLENNATSFKFVTVPPTGPGWSYKVVAYAG